MTAAQTRRQRRKPTNRHLAKMRAGRERVAREKRRAERLALDNYMDWLKLERSHYEQLLKARVIHGSSSDEAQEAEIEWRSSLELMPPLQTLPDDRTWRAMRGEYDSHATIGG